MEILNQDREANAWRYLNYYIILDGLMKIKALRKRKKYEAADKIRDDIISLGKRHTMPNISKMNIVDSFPLGNTRKGMGFEINGDDITVYGILDSEHGDCSVCVSTLGEFEKCKNCKYRDDFINCYGIHPRLAELKKLEEIKHASGNSWK